MTLTPAIGALAQASDTLARAIADPQSGAETAVATTIDITLLILGPLVGAFVGVVVSVLLSALLRKAFSKAATASSILARVRRPGHFTFAAWGAWAGLGIALVNPHLSDWNGASITTFLMHVLLIVALACLTWMAYAAAWVFEDAAKARQSSDQGRSRRFETQAQVLRRLTQSIAVVVGVVAVISTFEVARHAMTTVLASAGVISVIFGLAAQQTLGNVFAGLQLAFTDAIRVGDVVVAGEKKETGSVEEITLSYVVVRIWDERRLIIPSRYFTQTPFENWTRRAAAQLGTVELKLDWCAPVNLIRRKVEALLTKTDLWDGRTWTVQVTDSDQDTVTVRVLVSAKDSGTLSDLRTYLREHLIAWIVAEHPAARPARRLEPLRTVTVTHDPTGEKAASLAEELAGIVGSGANATGSVLVVPPASADAPAPGSDASKTPRDAAHAARMVAARRKHKLARRRAMAERQRELAHGGPSQGEETQVMSETAVGRVLSEGRVGVRPKSTDGPTTAVHGIDRTRILEAVDGGGRGRPAPAPAGAPAPRPAAAASAAPGDWARSSESTRVLPAVGSGPLPPPPTGNRPRQSAPGEWGGSAPRSASTPRAAGAPPASPASSVESAPARPEAEPVERGERFFSGSPEADERNAAMAGRRYDEEEDERRR